MSTIKGQAAVIGDKELSLALTLIGGKIQAYVLKSAFSKASKVAARRAKAKAKLAFKSRTGLLVKAIQGGVTRSRKDKTPMGRVRVSTKVTGELYGKPVKPFKYAHLVELGTKFTKSAHPFMLDAFNDQSVMSALTAEARRKFKQLATKKFIG